MVMMALFSSLVGATLAIRFRVVVLFPAIATGVVLVITVAGLKGSTIWASIIAIVVWTVFLQIGYWGSLLARLGLEATASTPQRSLNSTIVRN